MSQLEIMPRPGDTRAPANPWPTYPTIFRVSAAHEEGGTRTYAVSTQEFVADAAGRVRALRLSDAEWRDGQFVPVSGTDRELPADLVLLAPGLHAGPGDPRTTVVAQLGTDLDPRGNVARDASYMTSLPGVFVAGDAGRGQSLVVWAIAEGRSAAAAVDAYLTRAFDDVLHRPVLPTARPLVG